MNDALFILSGAQVRYASGDGLGPIDLSIAAANIGGVFSVRLDNSTGTEIGRYTVSTTTGGWSTWQTRTLTLSARYARVSLESNVHAVEYVGNRVGLALTATFE